jgi:hypothetical protein
MTVQPTEAAPHRLGWAVRVGVYVMLVVSALGAFLFDTELWQAARLGTLPVWGPLVPAAAFTAFVVIYSVDRWLLVRRRNYPLVRAFFQVTAAVVFLTFLWPRQMSELRAAREAVPPLAQPRLLGHRDPQVRAMACELAGLKHDATFASRMDEMARRDGDAAVRAACAEAIRRLNEPQPAGAPAP